MSSNEKPVLIPPVNQGIAPQQEYNFFSPQPERESHQTTSDPFKFYIPQSYTLQAPQLSKQLVDERKKYNKEAQKLSAEVKKLESAKSNLDVQKMKLKNINQKAFSYPFAGESYEIETKIGMYNVNYDIEGWPIETLQKARNSLELVRIQYVAERKRFESAKSRCEKERKQVENSLK